MFVSLSARALACALGLVIGFGSLISASAKDSDSPAPEPTVVDLFAGIDEGKLEATVIPRDAKKVTLQLKNNSDQPLAIRMPEAFAAVPIQAQFAGGGGGLFGGGGGGGFGQGGGNQAGNQGGGTQGLGVGGGGQNGVGNAGKGGRNRGGAPGLFNVPAGKIVKVKLTSVCLEYGKPEPHAHNEYAIKPIESLCDKPEVVSILRSLGNGDVSQEIAQLAAWNVANGTSFQQLASQTSKLGLHLPVYSESSISAAAELVASLRANGSADTSSATTSASSAASGGH
jgi:hypothetical protein